MTDVIGRIDEKRQQALLGGGKHRIEAQHKRVSWILWSHTYIYVHSSFSLSQYRYYLGIDLGEREQ